MLITAIIEGTKYYGGGPVCPGLQVTEGFLEGQGPTLSFEGACLWETSIMGIWQRCEWLAGGTLGIQSSFLPHFVRLASLTALG